MRLRFAPGVDQLIHYQRGWLRGDVLAGITVAAYLNPRLVGSDRVDDGLRPARFVAPTVGRA